MATELPDLEERVEHILTKQVFGIGITYLTSLLARILSETGVTRLRISSLQPQDIGPEMLDLWSDGRLCPHFHLPLQSGSDTVLGHMRRRYSASLYAETVELIRQSVPDVSITADVIVGFPGETEGEFEETYALCERIGFADMHVFPYSVRPGTSAAHFDSQVASADKSRRMRTLLDIAKSQAIEFRRGFQGRVRAVLWEEARDANSATSVWSGLTDNYIRVLARSSSDLTNQVTLARLGEQVDGAVFAEILP
ncbi:MAG: radical SAM protein [Chloroflexi bacterium]|nr:radical SAM protein [Chloroflexota bacterium]